MLVCRRDSGRRAQAQNENENDRADNPMRPLSGYDVDYASPRCSVLSFALGAADTVSPADELFWQWPALTRGG